jgi:lipoprotein-releasing system permease protein
MRDPALTGPLTLLIAWRFMRARRSKILSSTALAAFLATSLGVTAMVIALALMTGYTHDLKKRLIGLQGEIMVSPLEQDALEKDRLFLEEAAELEGVVQLGRVAYGEGTLSSERRSDGLAVVLRGIEPGSLPPALQLDGGLSADQVALAPGFDQGKDGVPGVLLGRELARKLEVAPGDLLRLVVLNVSDQGVGFRYRSTRFLGSFSTGFADFDARWLLLDRQVLEAARGGRGVDVIEIKVAQEADPAQVADRLEVVLGPNFMVQRWETLNRDLFAALALQELLLFLVLGLIVLVSTFNTAATLVILVRERLEDVGVLGALGFNSRQIFQLFVFYGMALGTAGILCGLLLGGGVAWVITEFELIRFDPEVAAIYFIDSVPFRLEFRDLAAVTSFSLIVTFLACALPARRAAKILPGVALRSE